MRQHGTATEVRPHARRPAGNASAREVAIRRALDTEKLNIVGEKHNDIDEIRRGREREFAHDRQFPNYWEEYNAFDNEEFFGDDPYLRAIDALNAARTKLDGMAEGALMEVNQMCSWIDQAVIERGRVGEQVRKDALQARIRPLFLLADAAEEVIAGGPEREIYKECDTASDELRTWLDTQVERGATADNISLERSDVMWSSALLAAESNYAGIWKVGNQHIGEIDAVAQNENLVTLTDKDVFDPEYATWEADRYPPPPPVDAGLIDMADFDGL